MRRLLFCLPVFHPTIPQHYDQQQQPQQETTATILAAAKQQQQILSQPHNNTKATHALETCLNVVVAITSKFSILNHNRETQNC